MDSEITRFFRACSNGHVDMAEEMACLPVLRTAKGCYPLFRFVEVLDELLDYDAVRHALPGLSYGQVAGAIAFLRQLVQHNECGVDLDETLDAEADAEAAAKLCAGARQELRELKVA